MLGCRIILFSVVVLLVASEESCSSNSACEDLNTCVNEKCVHKSLFPIATTEYIGTFILIIVSCIANAGGIGGSTISISTLLLLFKFDTHTSVGLTQVFISAGTFIATIMKFRDRHPTKDRPLIYYDILMIIIGPILLGVSLGVLLNPIFPEWLLLGLLTLLVILLLWDNVKRVKHMRTKEKQMADATEEDIEHEYSKSIITSFLYSVHSQKNLKVHSEDAHPIFESLNDNPVNSPRSLRLDSNLLRYKIERVYKEEKRVISIAPAVYFIFLCALAICFSLLKGTATSASIIRLEFCSAEYFSLTLGYFIVMICLILIVSMHLINKTKICEEGEYDFDSGDIHWDKKKCSVIVLLSFSTGSLGGLLGLGVGVIIGPLLLALGVRPEVSTISSTLSIFLSSTTAAAQFFISGSISIEYSLWLFVASALGSVLGIQILRNFAVKHKKLSYLIACIGLILFTSLLIIPTVGVLKAIDQSSNGVFQVGFAPMC